jgi:transposase
MNVTVYIGIDVSKEKLDCSFESPKGEHRKQFSNKLRGIDSLHHWGVARAPGEETVFVLESTGPYHQLAASVFDGLDSPVVVGNPKHPRAHAEGTGQLQKTDAMDARTIGRWAKACTPRRWKPVSLPMQELRALVIRLLALTDHERRERTRLGENPRVQSWIAVARSIQRMLKMLAVEKAALLDDIEQFYAAHPELRADRKLLQTIPGVGPQAADHLLCLIRERGLTGRQAAALAGVTPVHKRSGKCLNAKSRISRGGDGRVRAGLFMPALSAIQNNPRLKAFYERLLAAGVRPIGAVVAVIRKLITIAVAMLDKQQPFDAAHGMETAPALLPTPSLAGVS